MKLIKQVILKAMREFWFLTEQKWGILPPRDKSNLQKSKLKKYLPKNPAIIDCGAHHGSDSVELARIFPKGRIYSFEPLPEIYSKLLKHTSQYSNISCYDIALSNSNGVAKMHISGGHSDASSSLLVPTGHLRQHPDVSFDKVIKVETMTLDTWAEINMIKNIDFLWLDMQGLEFKMLEASKNIFPTVKVLYTEVCSIELYDGGPIYPVFRKWLKEKGFNVVDEFPDRIDPCNVLFVRK